MQVLETIRTRRSIRKFKNQDVPDNLINQILTAGTWAPYGRNQIWRFAVIKDPGLKSDIAKLTAYAKILENAPVVIPVFFDRRKTYHNMKDAQTMGACIQNMLLAIAPTDACAANIDAFNRTACTTRFNIVVHHVDIIEQNKKTRDKVVNQRLGAQSYHQSQESSTRQDRSRVDFQGLENQHEG